MQELIRKDSKHKHLVSTDLQEILIYFFYLRKMFGKIHKFKIPQNFLNFKKNSKIRRKGVSFITLRP